MQLTQALFGVSASGLTALKVVVTTLPFCTRLNSTSRLLASYSFDVQFLRHRHKVSLNFGVPYIGVEASGEARSRGSR